MSRSAAFGKDRMPSARSSALQFADCGWVARVGLSACCQQMHSPFVKVDGEANSWPQGR